MCETKPKRLRPGQARVQFLACKTEVIALLEKGHTMTEVLEILTKENSLNISYFSLRNLILEHIYKRPPRTRKKKETSIITATIVHQENDVPPLAQKTTMPQTNTINTNGTNGADRPKGPKMIGASTNTFIQSSNNFSRELETNSSTIEKEDKN